MRFPMDYPYNPPTVRFLTKMWHPNVYKVGLFKKFRSTIYILKINWLIELQSTPDILKHFKTGLKTHLFRHAYA